jgi:mannose-6-phosphate isomerase
MTKFNYDTVFPKVEEVGPRAWGREELLGLVSQKFTLKRLEIRAGHRGGLQYHHKKDEIAILISGSLLIRYDLGDGQLVERIVNEGEVVHFPPLLVHQEEAITDCVLIEASTPYFNDRVRVENLYGLDVSDGLPTTHIDEIVEK